MFEVDKQLREFMPTSITKDTCFIKSMKPIRRPQSISCFEITAFLDK